MKKNTESHRRGVGGVIELSNYTAEKLKFTALLLSPGVNNLIPTSLTAGFPLQSTANLPQVRSHMQLRVRAGCSQRSGKSVLDVTWISLAWYMIISPRRMIVERLIRHFRANEYRDSWKRAQH